MSMYILGTLPYCLCEDDSDASSQVLDPSCSEFIGQAPYSVTKSGLHTLPSSLV